MLYNFHVTYDVVTPESAEHSDYAESGFMTADYQQVELPAGCCGAAAGQIKDLCGLRLREAIELMSCVEDGGAGTSFYECDGRQDYRTGAETRYALHCPDHATGASLARIRRLLVARGLLRH